MFRKNHFSILFSIALLLAGSVVAFAQTGAPVGGQVLVKNEDGTTAPVAGALVEVFRVDIKSKFPSDKTDKKGYFKFAGLPFGATFALVISAPNISPELVPGVKAGMENLTINVRPGNGQKWTEDEVRAALAKGPQQSTQQQESPEAKKQREEEQKKIDETIAKNKKIEDTNKILADALAAGNKAYEAKDYNLAIQKFDEGYNADPDFAGSAPVFLNNKASALINRGTDVYNKSVSADAATKTAARESAKQDFEGAIEASERSLSLLSSASTTDAAQLSNFEQYKYIALLNRKNAFRLMAATGANRERGQDALKAFQDYLMAEPDAAKKTKAQMDLAMTLQDSNEFEAAIVEFEKILAEDPNNVDALVGIGLSMVNVGYINLDSDAAKGKEQLQQAANYLQRFVDAAPDTHKFKKDAIATIAELKEQQKVTPQKTPSRTTPTRRRNN